MYGFMAIAHFAIFPIGFGTKLEPTSLAFWFMMQIAMIFGFLTSCPVNWWLISSGIKISVAFVRRRDQTPLGQARCLPPGR
jgi:hypothetical protein